MAESQNRFVWYELTTTDMEAAKAFYAKVLGWGTENASTPGMPYALFTVGGISVGGLMGMPQTAKEFAAKPSWTGYIGVDDVDATADRIKRLGGAVYVPPTNINDISRFSVVADPQMATLVLVKWLTPRLEQPAAPGTPGRVGWHELLAADWEKAFAFYSDVFGWQKADADADPSDGYRQFSAGGQTIGGMFTKPPMVTVPFWLYFFNVGDIDAAAKQVKAAGGEILNGPMEVSDGRWIAECMDPQGALFAMLGKRSSSPIGYFERVARDPSDTRARRWSW
jgi:uncharacterized protein